MIEKEPVTIVLSEKGWIRAIRGHQTEIDSLAFKEGDRLKRAVKAQTTDTLLLFATNGRFYALGADKLPGGRGHGEPFRLMIDIEEAGDAVELFVHEPGRKLLVAGTSGHGFIVAEDEVLAMTRKGKQVLNVPAGRRGRGLRAGRRRQRGGDRRQPEASALPLERAAGDAARQGRAASALQGWRPGRRQGVQQEGRADLYRRGRPLLRPHRVAGLVGRAGPRPGGLPPKGFPKSNSSDRGSNRTGRKPEDRMPDYQRTASGF